MPALFKNTLRDRAFSDTDRQLLAIDNSHPSTTVVMMTPRTSIPTSQLLVTGLVSALLATTAWAAPATSQELNGSADASAAPEGSNARRAAPVAAPVVTGVPQSRTVELLLQMQDKPDFASGEGDKTSATERQRRSTSGVAGGTATKATSNAAAESEPNPLTNLKSTLLGTGTAQRSDSVDSREATKPATMDSSAMPSSNGAGIARRDDDQPRESLLSNPVVRFIRENRALTIGASLAVLIGLWLTATFSMRRSR